MNTISSVSAVSPEFGDNTTVMPVTTTMVLTSSTREKIIYVSFRSRFNTFTTELTNSSSASFTNRALLLKIQVCVAIRITKS